ncbi:SixA phosphatase family protein [Salipiger sp. CCB-MM3]|uniref:SixA phosphatase family protein n=1 Tax=Salipiger sp. CCB-MM3 TaxID=1792508 RepID=UPI00187DCAD8|nr:phosphoglycerate mutase family protein [Salipiger sp. CCB-MM3]
MRLLFLTILAVMATALATKAQEAVYIIRHAEKELTGDDPAITDEGKARAAAWAKMLEHVGLDVVFTSDAKRTHQTGAIIAETLGLPLNSVSRANTAGLIDALSFDHEEEAVLVVGHTETIPNILESLGVAEEIEVSQTDFANLFILLKPDANDPHLIRLRMP